MTKLSDHPSSRFVKMILIGDSGTGKTGALTSLVSAGYRLKILDLDNGLDSLKAWIGQTGGDLSLVDFETIRDPIKSSQGGPIVTAKAFVEATKLLDKWSDGSIPAQGGENEIFVLDSTTTFGKSAYEWAKSLAPSSKDPRQWYFAAQQAFENIIALLTSVTYTKTEMKNGKEEKVVIPGFDANVIVIAHVNYKDIVEGQTKGYPTAVGSALGPTIPKYFNTMAQVEVIGSGKNAQRRIVTVPSGTIDLKNPAPFRVAATYPIDTGLAELFKQLKAT